MLEQNKYIDSYINGYVRSFRNFNNSSVNIYIKGIKKLAEADSTCLEFIQKMSKHDIFIILDGDETYVSCIDVVCEVANSETCFEYQINNLTLLLEICCRSEISLFTLVIMKVVSMYMSRYKTIHKVLALDLDDTLWNGTLSEDGVLKIEQNLRSETGNSYIKFMNFIRVIAKELGIYIAICTRNDLSLVKKAFLYLDETIFPIKNQIDCIVSDDNDKSYNLTKIANQLSVLPSAIVFIDDNPIVRDEVREKQPDIFVPEWQNHDDLILQLEIGGYFDRNDLSISAKNRRKNFRIIKEEKKNNSLYNLTLTVHEDPFHIEAQKLYAKSNQFKLNHFDDIQLEDAKSLYFQIQRQNGENLGVCSCITYYITDEECVILNWAISCRYFEIGLEYSVMIYMLKYIHKNLFALCQFNENNVKASNLIMKCFELQSNFADNHFYNVNNQIFTDSINDKLIFIINNITHGHSENIGIYVNKKDETSLLNETNLKICNYE